MDIPLYIRHKITAYHWRRTHGDRPAYLAVCNCGWKDRIFRPGLRLRAKRVICFLRGHRWGEAEKWEVGRHDFEEGDGDAGGTHRQCSYCYKVVGLAQWQRPDPYASWLPTT